MLAQWGHGAGLRPSGTFTLPADETHFRPDFQGVVAVTDDAVAMKIDFLA